MKGQSGFMLRTKIYAISVFFTIFIILNWVIIDNILLKGNKNNNLIRIILIIFEIIAGWVITLTVINTTVKPMRRIAMKLQGILQNGADLTQRIGYDKNDEIGNICKNIDTFIEKLKPIIVQVINSANTIATASLQLTTATNETNKALEQIAQTISRIAGETSDNLAIVEETTIGLEEVVKFSGATAVASRRTSESSIKVRDFAEDGSSKVNEVVNSIKIIANTTREADALINDLGSSSKKIGEIVELITSISEQTNLLALNAAIEAARAGEAGRGFNVVAEEIRKLADGSNNAAKQIVGLVKENQAKAEKAVSAVNEVDRIVGDSVQKVADVGESINNILINIKDIVSKIAQMDKAISKQAATMNEMTESINIIANNTNETAAGTQQISSSIEEQVSTMEEIEASSNQLTEMADRLNELTAGFKVK